MSTLPEQLRIPDGLQRHVCLVAVLLLGAGAATLSACTNDTSTGEAWDVGDDGTPPVKQGVYNAEFEIVEDGCEPPLRELSESYSDWPPVTNAILVDENPSSPSTLPPYVRTVIYEVRTGEHGGVSANLPDAEPTWR